MNPIRVVVVDDQTLIREGLSSLLNLIPDLSVVGTAADSQRAVDAVATLHPDVVLMDVRMPGVNGVAATRLIRSRFPSTRVIVLTTFDRDEYVFESLRAGASGYLLKDADPEALAAAIRRVHSGDSVLDPTVTRRVIRRAVHGQPDESVYVEHLSDREREVLHWMAKGATNAEIAGQLVLSTGTVKNHVSHILHKLNARDRAHAVRLAVEWGLLDE